MFNKDDFFHKATLLICSSFQIEQALYRTYLFLRRHLPTASLNLCVVDAYGCKLKVIAKADHGGGQACTYAVPLSAASRQIGQQSSSPGRGPITRTPAENPIARDWSEFHGQSGGTPLVMSLRLENSGQGFLVAEVCRGGAFDVIHETRLSLLRKPFEIVLANALKSQGSGQPSALVSRAEPAIGMQPAVFGETQIVGADAGLQKVMKLARSVAGVHTPVLLLGETGVGKEIIADAIHSLSPRAASPIIKVNCGAISPSLIDSELFGHEKGAFTGALRRQLGRFERANGGTIFLDEIGELPEDAQVKLLRVLQSGEIERVGGTETVPTDIRLIAATHRNLADMVSRGNFRQDLWFRINVFPIHIPPLRHRPEDIPLLVTYSMKRKCRELGLVDMPEVNPQEVEQLIRYDWPGNVRELENLVERALLLTRGAPLSFQGLMPNDQPVETHSDSVAGEIGAKSLDEVMRHHIRSVLRQTNGRIQGPKGAAYILGLKASTLRSRMAKLGIPFKHKEKSLS